MQERLEVGDWIKFKSSGFVNEGRITEVKPESYRVEVPNGPTSIYVDLPKDRNLRKIDAQPGN